MTLVSCSHDCAYFYHCRFYRLFSRPPEGVYIQHVQSPHPAPHLQSVFSDIKRGIMCVRSSEESGRKCHARMSICGHFPSAKHEHGEIFCADCAKKIGNANVWSIAEALAARSNALLLTHESSNPAQNHIFKRSSEESARGAEQCAASYT